MINEELLRLVEGCCLRHSARIIDVTVRGSQQKAIIKIFVDSEAGVTTDLCSQISREASALVEEQKLMAGSYTLVVSSPGIERPLKYAWQYKKHKDRKLSVRQKSAEGTREVAGKLIAVDEHQITVETGNENLQIRFDEIIESTVKAPW